MGLKTETQCATASTDHISNIVTDGATTSMDLDEDLNFVDASVDISVQAPIVPAVAVQLDSLPIAFSPTIPAGKLTFIDKNVAAPLHAIDIATKTSYAWGAGTVSGFEKPANFNSDSTEY